MRVAKENLQVKPLICGGPRCSPTDSGVLWTLGRIEVAMENKRVQIEPIRPNDRSMVPGYLGEVAGIPQRFEHRTPRVASEIDRPLDAVVEDKPQTVWRHNRDWRSLGEFAGSFTASDSSR